MPLSFGCDRNNLIVVVCWLWFLFSRISLCPCIIKCVCTRQSWFTWWDDADVRQSERSKRISQYRNVLRLKFEGKKKKSSRQKRMRLWLWLSDGAPGGFFNIWTLLTFFLIIPFLLYFFFVCVALSTGNHFRLPLPKELRTKKKETVRFTAICWVNIKRLFREKKMKRSCPDDEASSECDKHPIHHFFFLVSSR